MLFFPILSAAQIPSSPALRPALPTLEQVLPPVQPIPSIPATPTTPPQSITPLRPLLPRSQEVAPIQPSPVTQQIVPLRPLLPRSQPTQPLRPLFPLGQQVTTGSRLLPTLDVPLADEVPIPDVLPPQEVLQAQDVRPLPGQLDAVPVFNSNSPELVQTQGILLSTFPPEGKESPRAHLNFAFDGRFDIFAHHLARARIASQTRTLFLGVLISNPSNRPVAIDVLQGASYLTRPDAQFVDLPSYVEDPLGRVFAGPGSRTMNDILRGRRQVNVPSRLVIPPGVRLPVTQLAHSGWQCGALFQWSLHPDATCQ